MTLSYINSKTINYVVIYSYIIIDSKFELSFYDLKDERTTTTIFWGIF